MKNVRSKSVANGGRNTLSYTIFIARVGKNDSFDFYNTVSVDIRGFNCNISITDNVGSIFIYTNKKEKMMRTKTTVESLFLDILQRPDDYSRELYYDNEFITDGNIVIYRKFAPVVNAVLEQKAKKLMNDTIIGKINQKGTYAGYFEVKGEYKNCYYHMATDSCIIPVDFNEHWGIDNRWLLFFNNQFAIDDIYVFPYEVGKEGCIFQIRGWADGEEYTDKESYIIGYILGCYIN